MKQITLALINYADSNNGRLPPAVLYDREGRPLHSWRVLILPYVEGGDELYRAFRLDEPWDSPHNLALLPRMPRVYALPRGLPAPPPVEPSSTFYQVFVGKGTAFEGTEGLRYQGDFPDGLSTTILVVEAGEAVPWTKPVDLVYQADQPLPPLGGIFTGKGHVALFGSSRLPGFHVGLADSTVRFVEPGVSEATLRHAITRNDGQELGPLGLEW